MINQNSLILACVISLFSMGSCASSSEKEQNAQSEANADSSNLKDASLVPEGTQVAEANLTSTSDSTINIGTAKFYQLADGKIKMNLEMNLKDRADSNVAVHFHEHGDCGNKGMNTHDHWNPTKEAHGAWGSAAYHSGDIGNIKLDAYGIGTISVTTDRWSVDAMQQTKNIIGKGIIVHGGTDDYATQPTGNSGPRIGCGVISKL